jgi:hypothetical protein
MSAILDTNEIWIIEKDDIKDNDKIEITVVDNKNNTQHTILDISDVKYIVMSITKIRHDNH